MNHGRATRGLVPGRPSNMARSPGTKQPQLTVHGVTKELEFPLEAQLVNNTIVIVGSTNITFSDYGVAVPASRIVVSVEDSGILELQLLLVR